LDRSINRRSDTYHTVGFVKGYDWKMLVTAVDLLNDRGIPLFEQQDILLD
jgi:hypothetical protein